MLGRAHVHLRRLGHNTSELASAVHDVVPCDLSEVDHRARNGLVPLRLFLVQKSVLMLFGGELRSVAWNTGSVKFAMPNVSRIDVV